jgi:hypothetical protein
MTACPSRYLTADGRVLRCDLEHGDAPEAHGTGADTRGRRLLMWRVDAPCVWDATCTTCEGVGEVLEPLPNGFVGGCVVCDGTGVDETIPLRMIGAGSVFANGDRAVFVLSDPVGFDAAWSVTWTSWRWAKEPTPTVWFNPTKRGDWTVVRAVPPAHTEAPR